MKEVNNVQLGKFGFLLDFNEDFLFELAQLAESNLYVNKRLCAVYIRQLTEGFFDTVIEKEKIEIDITQMRAYDGAKKVPTIKNKQDSIVNFFNDSKYRKKIYGKKAFPKCPGSAEEQFSRLPCPEGEGDDKSGDRKTLYVWSFIRRLGNAGSHAVLSEENKRWLEEKYIIEALRQLYLKMQYYFYGANNRIDEVDEEKYSPEQYSLASRVIFYPQEDGKMFEQQGILPGYVEKKYYTVMPKSGMRQGKVYWKNYINKYLIIRRYEMISGDSIRDYLLQSQKAYLILQQTGKLDGIAPYAVLADLRNNADYYVTSYEFDVEPLDLCAETLQECGVYESEKKLLLLLLRFVKIMLNLSDNRVYHRNLTHNSIKLCKFSDNEFELKIIDFELVKLYEQEELTQETVYKYVNEQAQLINNFNKVSKKDDSYGNIRQYGVAEWDENTTESEYQKAQKQRTGMIMDNLLSPNHFDNSQSYPTVASLEEVMEPGNIVMKSIDSELVRKLFDLSNDLREKDDFSLMQAYDKIGGMLDEYRED